MEETDGLTKKKTLTFKNEKKKSARRSDSPEYRILSGMRRTEIAASAVWRLRDI